MTGYRRQQEGIKQISLNKRGPGLVPLQIRRGPYIEGALERAPERGGQVPLQKKNWKALTELIAGGRRSDDAGRGGKMNIGEGWVMTSSKGRGAPCVRQREERIFSIRENTARDKGGREKFQGRKKKVGSA